MLGTTGPLESLVGTERWPVCSALVVVSTKNTFWVIMRQVGTWDLGPFAAVLASGLLKQQNAKKL